MPEPLVLSAVSTLAHPSVGLLIQQAGLTDADRPVLRPDRNQDDFVTEQGTTWHVVHNSQDARGLHEVYTDDPPTVRVVVLRRGGVVSDVTVRGRQATWLRRLLCILHQKKTRRKGDVRTAAVRTPNLTHLARTV